MKFKLDPAHAEPGADARHFELLEKLGNLMDGQDRQVALDVLMNICAIVLLEVHGRSAPDKAKEFGQEIRRCVLKNARIAEKDLH